VGLKFNKMLDESIALYDVQGMISGAGSTQFIGQIAVRTLVPPAVDHVWVIKPLGVIAGWNTMGASINIPLIEVEVQPEPEFVRDKDGKVLYQVFHPASSQP
jgi:hypothetical protein